MMATPVFIPDFHFLDLCAHGTIQKKQLSGCQPLAKCHPVPPVVVCIQNILRSRSVSNDIPLDNRSPNHIFCLWTCGILFAGTKTRRNGCCMPQTEAGIRQEVERSLDKNDIITFRTYYLSDYGEMVLRVIASSILERFGRSDLMDIVYSAAKELIINATKANLKRVVFTELGLDLLSPSEYEKGMHIFKERLVEDKVKEYEKVFKEMDYPVVSTFYYWPNVLNIKVKNSFMLPARRKKKDPFQIRTGAFVRESPGFLHGVRR